MSILEVLFVIGVFVFFVHRGYMKHKLQVDVRLRNVR
jgi:hypothetical protein